MLLKNGKMEKKFLSLKDESDEDESDEDIIEDDLASAA